MKGVKNDNTILSTIRLQLITRYYEGLNNYHTVVCVNSGIVFCLLFMHKHIEGWRSMLRSI